MRTLAPPKALFAGADANSGGQTVLASAQTESGSETGGYPPGLVDFIRSREGYKTYVYLDSRLLPTAGLGHLLVGDELSRYPLGTTVPQSVLDAWEKHDLDSGLAAARSQIAQLPPAANTNDFLIAMVSVNFQLGSYWYTEHRRTWAFMKAGQWENAAVEAADSDWATQTPVRLADFQRALRSLAGGGSGSPVEGAQAAVQGNGNTVATASGSITGDDVNVRQGPGTSYTAVRQLNTGDSVSVYETRNGWVRIAAGQWVKADFVRQTTATRPSTPATQPSPPVTQAPPTTQRPPATTPSTPTTQRPPTTAAPVTSSAPRANIGSGNPVIGTGVINAQDVNVRSGPGTEHSTVGNMLDKGLSISFYESRDGWHRIGDDRWVSSQFVDTHSRGGGATPSPVRETGIITGSDLNVRTGPGTNYPTTGNMLQRGYSVPIYEVRNGWLRVGDGRWVFGNYVNYSGNRPATTAPSTPVQPPVTNTPRPAPQTPTTPTRPVTPPTTVTPPATTTAPPTTTTGGTATGSTRPPVTISGSVGADGQNSRADVLKIQQLLKDVGFTIGVDGGVGHNTIGAICAVQNANYGSHDGRVDAGGRTLEILNNTPNGAFRNTAQQFRDDPNAPRLSGSWVNAAKLTTDTSGEVLPRPLYTNMRNLIRNLDVIRANVRGSLQVGSGYRSPAYNSTVEGAASQSNHQLGRACDIYSDLAPTELRAELRRLIREGKLHNGGIGLYSWGCHYDIDSAREW